MEGPARGLAEVKGLYRQIDLGALAGRADGRTAGRYPAARRTSSI